MLNPHIRDYAGKKIHMIGIGGSSMSGLCLMLKQLGYDIQGSDNSDSYIVDMLREKGINVVVGHKAENILGVDLIIYTAAISKDNVERQEADRLNIPQIERKTLLGQIMEEYENAICICGTHGKTTTSAMTAKILLDCNKNPSIHIGGMADEIGGSTRIGSRDIFVAEACEFNASFLSMNPSIAVLLNVKEDHLDFYKDIDDIENSFRKFLNNLKGHNLVVVCGDDERALKLAKEKKKYLSFGFSEKNDYRAENIKFNKDGCASFNIILFGKNIINIELSVPGKVQVLDALAAFVVAHYLGCEIEDIAKSLNTFHGVHRRFELTGIYDGVKVYHDYAHNPEEMLQVLQTASMLPHNRLWAVMQPHTYSRVKRLFDEYIDCTSPADITLVTDICAAREKNPGDINSQDIVNAMKEKGVDVHLTPSFEDTKNFLINNWQSGDIVVTLGCGDINKLNIQMEKELHA